jgi:hypothetical protein
MTTTRPAYYLLDHAYREATDHPESLQWIHTVGLTCPTLDDAYAKLAAIVDRFAPGDTHRFELRRVGGAQ